MATLPKDVPLTLGHKVTVSIRGQKYDVALRGWCVGQYIITEAPLVNGDPIRLAPNTGCEVHFIKEGEFFTFKSSVMFIYPHVVTLMIIEFPKAVDSHNLRKHKRVRMSCPTELSYTVTNKPFTDYGIIRDLSLTGALITHKKVLQKDNKIVVKANLSSGELSQDAVVQNVRHNPKNEAEPYVTGVKFPVVKEETKIILQKFIETRAGNGQQKA
ncbi:MAG: hypothetical protein A3K09_01050 [Nitrospinae bacterium RIFCSPLOWO2_12_FULL_47_7]|nr:MAG: hypothetical protein A3K09_01050 [Nitrospinae bacterium RIFCSPLOWO2_12_FULL_47_7]